MKRGRRLNVRKSLEKIKIKENRARVRKHYQYVINNYDIVQLLRTIEKKTSELNDTIRLSHQLRHKIIEFYNNVFSKRVRGRVIEIHLVMEVSRDLRTSVHLAQFGYYKAANATLRNIFETGFRFLYFSQFPEKFIDFGRTEDWHSISVQKIKFIKFKEPNTTKAFLNHFDKLCKYTHTFPSTFGTNFIGFNPYNEKLFDEWFTNFKDTIYILEKSLMNFTL